jgi:hypothetical protein
MTRAFRRSGDSVVVGLADSDRALIGQLRGVLEAVGDEPGDPAFGVLHRDAYRDDEEASGAFSALTAGETASLRGIDRLVLDAVAQGAEELSRAEALSLVRSINEARLALGARAGAFDMGPRWADHIGGDQRLAVVAWLGSLQVELLRVMPPAR